MRKRFSWEYAAFLFAIACVVYAFPAPNTAAIGIAVALGWRPWKQSDGGDSNER